MKEKTLSKLLSLLLAAAMLLSLVPMAAMAAGNEDALTKVALSDVAEGDTVLITMHAPASKKDYALLNTGDKGPAAVFDGKTLAETMYWNVAKSGEGYKLYPAGQTAKWLCVIDNNNGAVLGTDADTGVWTVDASGYLKATDPSGNVRYLGVYDNNGGDTSAVANPNFRTYKNTTGNTKDQTLTVYKVDTTKVKFKCATPATVSGKSEVIPGEKVALKCATAGAALEYKVENDTAWQKIPLGGEQAFTVAEDAAIGTRYQVQATKDGYDPSDALVLTVADPNPPVAAVKLTAAPKDGETVAIYHPASKAAMGTVPNGKKIAGVVTEPDGEGKLSVTADVARLEVGVDGENYTFSLDGKYLTSAPTGNGLSFEADLTNLGRWTLKNAGEGIWYIHNVGANYNGNYNQGMEYYNGFTTYGEKETDVYQMAFYLVKEAPVLRDGQKVVVYNPGSGMAMSTAVKGNYYLEGTPVTVNADGTATVDEKLVWTVKANDDGTYSFLTGEGKKLSMNADRNSLPLDEVNNTWKVEKAATEGCWYLINAGRPTYYVEWYANYTEFSTYTYNSKNETIYALRFLTPAVEKPATGIPSAGDQVAIYNLSAQGVLSVQDDNAESPSITCADATVAEGKATLGNGGVVFTVEENGEWRRFKNETFGYLCSTGTGNNAYYSQELSEDADWKLAVQGTGYTMESRTAKFNGQYSQYLEYYAGAFKTYSMNKVTDYDIFTFQFYSVTNETLTGGVANLPAVVPGALSEAFVGSEYTFTFTVETVFGVQGSMAAALNGQALTVTENAGVYTVTVPAEKVTGEKLVITVSGTDVKGAAISGTVEIPVRDEPVFSDMTPAQGAQTGDEKRPVISVRVANCGAEPTVTMTVNGEAVLHGFTDGVVSYTPSADLPDGRVNVTVTVRRADGKEGSKSWSFTIGVQTEALYFGQLHSHTQYSDGAGSLTSALEYVKDLPQSANIDFVAFTDHSNYFDKSGEANVEDSLYDMTKATAYSQGVWKEYKDAIAAFNAENNGVVALGGYEMTWSGGPGHINTWVTPGIVSRNNSTLNNKTADAGMKAYYALLSRSEGADSISQFNHPGVTFGNFSDFSYWDAITDTRMYLVEVGNGEGAIGQGGYYPSYEQYTMALDKGWHLAPTNNQDNHKGKWGNANDARDVILAEELTEQGLYDAIRQYKVYATEDKNLEIRYTVNDLPLGSIIGEIPEKLNVNVQVYDPDAADSISKVELIVNSGRVAYTWDDPAVLAGGELTCQLAPDYSYYYVRVTQGDGDLAVTAPVWVGETLKLGVSSVECDTAMPVTGEAVTINTTLFNSEKTDAVVKSMTYTTRGSVVLGTDTTEHTIPAAGTLVVPFSYTPTEAKVMTITVTAVLEQDGKEYEYSMDVTLDVTDADKVYYIGIDASHYNEYVAGNYKDSMGNFANLAAPYGLRTVYLSTSEEFIAAANNAQGKYKLLILTAPSRRLAAAQSDPRTYSAEEIAAIKAFNEAGGTVVLAGWSDYYENYPVITGNPDVRHMAATQNEILAALGSSLRITDDATHDDSLNGGQSQRLYFNSYNMDSFLMSGVEVDSEHPNDRMYTEVFSQYGGATIHTVGADGQPIATVPATVETIVFGHATTYSKDSDNDGIGGAGVPKYPYAEGDERLLVMASEQLPGKGLIIVSGAAFMSNFEVQATISDSNAEKNYANYKVCENLCQYVNPMIITPIADVQAEKEEGVKFNIEGVVTSNASGFDKNTAFFDCIYLQDATAGINAFPVAGNYKIGDRVRITGTTSSYQGERQIAVSAITLLGEGEKVEPKAVTAAQVNDGSVLGSLITVSGTVERFALADGLVQTIMVADGSGESARVFIDGYITTARDVEGLETGCSVTVTGLASYDNSFDGPAPRIRIRDRADVVVTAAAPDVPFPSAGDKNDQPQEKPTAGQYTDLVKDAWYMPAMEYVVSTGLMEGISDTAMDPEGQMTRGMFVTLLYRLAGEPEVTGESVFTDVKSGDWFEKAVLWGTEKGVVKGMTATTFEPDSPVTREQMAVFLCRYRAAIGENVAQVTDEALKSFSDYGDVSLWALEAVIWATDRTVMEGSDGKLLPLDTATRAETAQLFYNLYVKR